MKKITDEEYDSIPKENIVWVKGYSGKAIAVGAFGVLIFPFCYKVSPEDLKTIIRTLQKEEK